LFICVSHAYTGLRARSNIIVVFHNIENVGSTRLVVDKGGNMMRATILVHTGSDWFESVHQIPSTIERRTFGAVQDTQNLRLEPKLSV
jgi:hypothetical protein